jgi:hypothetical protein
MMNKLFVFIIALFAIPQVSYTQNDVFLKDDKVVGASVGFINTIGRGWKSTSPTITLTGEYGIVDGLINGKASIGVGPELSYTKLKYNNTLSPYKYSNLRLGARGTFHYQFVDKLDTYAGLFLGYDIVSGESTYAASDWGWATYIGARYYFSDKFAVTAESGNNISLINIGIAYKF